MHSKQKWNNMCINIMSFCWYCLYVVVGLTTFSYLFFLLFLLLFVVKWATHHTHEKNNVIDWLLSYHRCCYDYLNWLVYVKYSLSIQLSFNIKRQNIDFTDNKQIEFLLWNRLSILPVFHLLTKWAYFFIC